MLLGKARRAVAAAVVGCGISQLGMPAAATQPRDAEPTFFISSYDAAQRAFALCLEHVSGKSMSSVAPAELRSAGFWIDAKPPEVVVPPFAEIEIRAYLGFGVMAVIAASDGSCNIVASQLRTAPVEAAIKEQLAATGSFAGGSRLGDSNWKIWTWARPGPDVRVGMSARPHQNYVVIDITARPDAGND